MKYNFKTIEELKGKTITEIRGAKDGSREITFFCHDGESPFIYKMFHDQCCCEKVSCDKVVGDINNLIGAPILKAREEIAHNEPDYDTNSCTLTDFILETERGRVTLHWIGTSNGMYSEAVYFIELNYL